MKYALKIFGLIVVIVFIVVIILTKRDTLSHPQKTSQTSDAQTTLSFTQNPLQLTTEEGTDDIVIDTGENSISFIQIQLAFNPAFVKDMHIRKGVFFNDAQVLNNYIDTTKGTATYILTLPTKSKGRKGKGVVASVSFNSSLRKGDTTPLTFTKETMVTDPIHTTSVLKNTVNTMIIQKELP